MYVKRRKASVLVTPVAVREQYNASVVWGKTVASARSHAQGSPGTFRIVIEQVHLNGSCTYLSVIKHALQRVFFCNSSKSRTPVDLQVRR